MMNIVLAVLVGWMSTLTGVALGGWLVYRTKRDPYDPMFTAGRDKGDAFIVDEIGTGSDAPSSARLPKAVEAANSAFVDQFAEALASKAGGE